jgi:hypothetical protein
LLFPAAPTGGSPPALGPVDFAEIHRQLQSNKYVTLQLLWEEYRQSQPEDIATVASASCTSAGGESKTWSYAKTTVLAKRCLSIGPAPRFRFTAVSTTSYQQLLAPPVPRSRSNHC